MSQALASLSRHLLTLLICICIVACNGSYTAFESDRDFDVDDKTADIEQDNAELKTLAALQSAFFGHYQSTVNDFLDASDLPIEADPFVPQVPSENFTQYEKMCSEEGSIIYSFTRGALEIHEVGDRVSVSYEECKENGYTYSGDFAAKYTKLDGLNRRFTDIDTNECVESLQDELNISASSFKVITYDDQNDRYESSTNDIFEVGAVENITENVSLYLQGDELRFERVGNDLKVDLLRVSFVDDTDDNVFNEVKTISVELSFIIQDNQKVIVILEPLNSSVDSVTSIDGDEIYTVENLKEDIRNCQAYERTLEVTMKGLSTDKHDFLKTTLDGKVTLVEASESSNRINQLFEDSAFTTTVQQENSTQRYSMKTYRVEKATNFSNNSYAYEFQGFVSNDEVLGGQIALTTLGKLFGSFDSDFPSSGVFELRGQGLEAINAEPDNLNLVLKVDFNGDSTGNGFPDIDLTIDTTWTDLFERNFQE